VEKKKKHKDQATNSSSNAVSKEKPSKGHKRRTAELDTRFDTEIDDDDQHTSLKKQKMLGGHGAMSLHRTGQLILHFLWENDTYA